MTALATYYGPETFERDEQATQLAANLMEYYTRPRIEVGPLEVVDTENPKQ